MRATAIFMVMLAFGVWLNERSWNGRVYVYVGEDRAPAAVRTMSDYSSLDRQAFYRSAHEQMMAYAQVFTRGGDVGIQLGHPLVARNGGREFGCQIQDRSGVYDRMEMVFAGVGVSDGGETPHMTVDTDCAAQADLNKLATVWIPVNAIRTSRAKEQMFQADDQSTVSVQLQSIPDQWPESWVLWSVKLYRAANPEDALFVDANQLRLGQQGLLSFKSN